MGKRSHDTGTPALAMPGRMGAKCARAAPPEKPSNAIAMNVTTRYVVCTASTYQWVGDRAVVRGRPLRGRPKTHGDGECESSGLEELAEKASRRIICNTVGVPSVVETITKRPTDAVSGTSEIR